MKSKIERGVTSHPIHMGGAKVALPFTNYIVCHFHATYVDSITGDPALKKNYDRQMGPDNESLCKI